LNIRVWLLLALWTSLAQTNAPSHSSDPIYGQLRSLKITGETAAVTGLTIHRDAATFIFNRGEFHFTAPVQGKVVAAVFIGDGEIRLDPPTAVERHTLEIFVKDGVLVEPFSELVLFFTDNTYEEITGGVSINKGTPSQKASSILEDRMMLLRKGKNFSKPNVAVDFLKYNLPARLLADIYDPSHAGFFTVFIKGKRFEHLMFRIDPTGVPLLEPEEVVLASFNDGDLGIWNSFHLRTHYSAGAAVADENHRLLDIQHQEIQATIKGTELRAKTRTTINMLADGPRVLRFDLYPTLRVNRVADNNGRELQFIQEKSGEDSDLIVIFPESLQRGKYTLEFEYSGDGAIKQLGAGNFALIARENWYPSSTFGDRATYDMTFRIPKDLVMVASGHPQGSSQQGNEVVTRWKSEVPLAVAGFNFGRFKKIELNDDKTKYLIESYANINPTDLFREIKELVDFANFDTTRLMDKSRNEAQAALSIYQNYFGGLPYGRLAMTQQPFVNFGQAWPMLVYMPITSYFDSTTRNTLGLTGAADFFKIVGPHEVAHQWWGHIVGWKSYRDQWMSEGFAEFSASLFAHLVYGDEKFLDFWKDQRQRIVEKNEMGRRPADIASVTMGYRADNARTGNVTRNLIYPKGAFILHMIRMMMYDSRSRDERFIAMMRDFVASHRNQNVSTEDFKGTVEKHMTPEMDITGTKTMDWFFNQFVYGTEIPRYKLDYQLATEGQQTILKMRVTQSEVSPNFRMAVPVYLETEDKKLAKLGVVRILGNSSQDSTVTLGFRPKRVLLAAYEDVLANIDQR
jgi:Peptidase family M1 domain